MAAIVLWQLSAQASSSYNSCMLFTIIALTLSAMFLAALRLRRQATPMIARIDALLPQTQCEQCGFPGCRPYAEAIATAQAEINRCPPGGERVIRSLAQLTGHPVKSLDQTRGVHKSRHLARIDEAHCIGCTLCIQACPVDAIVGAPKLMHTVIAAHCTGCELCLPPCPVDCIVLEPAPWSILDVVLGRRLAVANAARSRFESRKQRLERNRREHAERMAAKIAAKRTELNVSAAASRDPADERKRAIVEAAVERARAKLAAMTRH
jgi:Na+-translocating ferredoxin:NAD+ oxidoreductase subunit B